MKKKCAIIGTDARLSLLKEALSNELDVKMFSSTVWDEEAKKSQSIEFATNIIFLPIQALAVGSFFRFT